MGQRGLLWVIALSALALLLVFVAQHFDEYLRRTLESKINQRLHGYSVSIGHAHVNPFGLALTLRDGVIRQQAHPDPPVADIPRIEASVEWKELLHFHLVANALFDHPRIHVNLPQLREEDRDRVKIQDRGWQDALEAIYPFKMDLFRLRNGTITYVEKGDGRPLRLRGLNIEADDHPPSRRT